MNIKQNIKRPAGFVLIILLTSLLLILLTGCPEPLSFSEMLDGPDGTALTVSPESAQLVVSESLTLAISGGVPPYTTSLSNPLGGTGEFLSGTTYTASDDVTGTAQILITDSYGASKTADISVVASSNTQSLSLSPSAITIQRGNSVSLAAAGGSGSYSYSLETSIGGSGESLSDNIYTAPADTDGTAIVQVNDGINTAEAAVTVYNASASESDVNYSLLSITNTGGSEGGSVLTAEFIFSNSGTDDGSENVSWVVYSSLDDAIGTGDSVIASGVTTPLSALSDSSPIEFSGSWPSPAIDTNYYLIVQISAGDDLVSSDNTGSLSELITAQATSDVDYIVYSFITSPYSSNGGDSISKDFTLYNQGTDTGTKDVYWKVYRSADISWDDEDILLQSGMLAAPLEGLSESSEIYITENWPEAAGEYYLIIRIFADDDTNLSNNVETAGPYTISSSGTEVDYYVSEISRNYPTVSSGELCSETFRISNLGGAAGTEEISWAAYASTHTNPGIGTDILIADSESSELTALGVGESYVSIPINGYWPSDAGEYYLIVEVSAADEVLDMESNNSSYNGLYTLIDPPDYKVSSPSIQEIGTPGAALGDEGLFQFSITEENGNAGNQPIHWEVFASLDSALDDGDVSIKSSSISALDANGDSGVISFADAFWPDFGAYYYLFIIIDAEDDSKAQNNSYVSASSLEVLLRYTESVDSTANVYSGTPVTGYSSLDTLTGGSLELNQKIKITDDIGLSGEYDTYGFTAGSGVTSVKMYSQWDDDNNSIELLFLNESGDVEETRWYGINREPETGYFTVTGLVPGETYFFSVSFNYGGSGNYDLFLLGAE